MQKNTQKTATAQTPAVQYLPAMLENAYSTSLENRIAQMNNQLAREGRLSNDPLVQIMLGFRHDLKSELGLTFERQIPGQTVAAPMVQVAPKAAPVQVAAPAPKEAVVAAKPAKIAPAANVRLIKAEQLASLQVAGSETEVAIYGTDKNGRILAPYGVKTDGTPARRRGRVAASEEPQATMPEPNKAGGELEVLANVMVTKRREAAPETSDDLDFDLDAPAQAAPTVTASTESQDDDDAEIEDLLNDL